MTTWYLFRHALATENKGGYGDEILSAQILPVGIPPTERMAEYIQHLPKSVNWSSELTRCTQTTNMSTARFLSFDSAMLETLYLFHA